jgi:hypothetical protein
VILVRILNRQSSVSAPAKDQTCLRIERMERERNERRQTMMEVGLFCLDEDAFGLIDCLTPLFALLRFRSCPVYNR